MQLRMRICVNLPRTHAPCALPFLIAHAPYHFQLPFRRGLVLGQVAVLFGVDLHFGFDDSLAVEPLIDERGFL